MIRLVTRRLVRSLVAFVLLTLGTMFLVDLSPVDPAVAIAGERAPQEVLDAVTKQYHLDDPVATRYVRWLSDIVRGDLGRSSYTNQPVSDMISQRLPVTLELTGITMFLVVLVVVPLGLYAAYRNGSVLDRVTTGMCYGFLSIPTFVMGLVLVTIFSIWLDVLPVSGWVALSESLGGNLEHILLPVLTLAFVEAAVLLQVFRQDALQTLQQEHITLARSKGLSTTRILWRHTLRLSSLSLMTLLGLNFARLLGGAVIVEAIFALPGLGSLLLGAIQTNDVVTVQGVVVLIGVSYLAINLLVDVLHTWLDPRLRAR